MSNYLVQAIRKLRPNSEFSFTDNDYSTIKWDVLDGEAPTQAEINAAIEQVKADEIAKADVKAAKREALLSRLGITEEEARILLG
jgi:hypothetical protein